MYAIRIADALYPERFDSWDEAVEFAQESAALPPDEPWDVVFLPPGGGWVPSPAFGV